jgi:hypothetical protein
MRVVLAEPGYFRRSLKAKRRIAAALQNSVYASACDKVMRKHEEEDAAAPSPEPAAVLIERILNNPDPKTHHTVGLLTSGIHLT